MKDDVMTYEKYLSDCKAKGFEATMTEKQFDEMLGVEPKHKHEPLPQRLKKPTLKQSLTVEKSDHIVQKDEVVEPKKTKPSIPPKKRPSQRKRPKLSEEELREKKRQRQREFYQRKVGREVNRRASPMNLSHMTPEEKRQHRLRKQKEYRERRKANGIKEVRSPQQRAKRNEYFKQYYERKKNDPAFMAKRAKRQENYRERLSA